MQHKHTPHKKRFTHRKIYRKKRDLQSIRIATPLMITVLFIIVLSVFTNISQKKGVIQPLTQTHNAAPQTAPANDTSVQLPVPAAQIEPTLQAIDTINTSVFVTVTDGSHTSSGIVALQDHPEWIHSEKGMWSNSASIDVQAIEQTIVKDGIAGIRLVQNSEVLRIETDAKNVLRPVTSTVAKAGFKLDTAETAKKIADALIKNEPTVTINAPYTQPTVTMTNDDGSKKTLTLLSTGYSDFAGSTPGRTSNVHKAIEERIKSILVRKGETFSLIPALDAPITLDKGWKLDLGLFGGGAALTPGAGICQSATTLYRAALLAGLPIVEKRNHSLFVDHYELYGIGLDATIFPYDINGKNTAVNLRFKNDTPDDLYIQSHIEGNTVLVQLFGNDDGRTALLEGPYFATSKNRPKTEIRALNNREIGWVRTVTKADGTAVQQPLIATYAKPVWRSVVKKFDGVDGMSLLVPAEYK